MLHARTNEFKNPMARDHIASLPPSAKVRVFQGHHDERPGFGNQATLRMLNQLSGSHDHRPRRFGGGRTCSACREVNEPVDNETVPIEPTFQRASLAEPEDEYSEKGVLKTLFGSG